MPMYLFQGKFTPEAFKALIARPHDRTEAARKVIEAAGGKLHQYFYAFGEYDVVVLMEYPDNAACTAALMAVAAGGGDVFGEDDRADDCRRRETGYGESQRSGPGLHAADPGLSFDRSDDRDGVGLYQKAAERS